MSAEKKTDFQVVNHSLPRRDGRVKVTGKAQYVADLKLIGMRDHRGIRESAQALEITVTDGPNVRERHIDRHRSLSGLPFDTPQRDDLITRSDELLCNEMDVERLIKAREKPFEHILKTFEMAAANRHPQRQIVDDVRCLQASQRLSMPWCGRFVKCANAVLIICFAHCFFLQSSSFPARNLFSCSFKDNLESSPRHVFRITAVVADTRNLERNLAGDKITAAARITVAAVAPVPADADPLALCPSGAACAYGIDDTGDLMILNLTDH